MTTDDSSAGRIEELLELLEADPDDYFTCFCLGQAYLEAHQTDQAVMHLESTIRLNPDYPVAHRFLGQAYEELERYPEAIRVWEEGLQVAERTALYQTGKEIRVFISRLEKRLASRS